MIIFQLICLLITFYVLEKYIVIGVYSKIHRLLPLLLVVILLYDFYQILRTLTGYDSLFAQMEDLLLLQMIYLLIHYIMDYQYIKLNRILENMLFMSLLLMDVFVLFKYDNTQEYKNIFLGFVIFFVIILLILATYVYTKYTLTRHQYHVSSMLYAVFLLQGVSLILGNIFKEWDNVIMLTTLACACICINYLITTEKLTDIEILLQGIVYDTSEVAIIIFDTDYYCVGANMNAKKLFPEELKEIRWKKRIYPYMQDVKEMAVSQEKKKEVEHNGSYYQCQIAPSYYTGKLRGYILSVWDITKQKQETMIMAQLKKNAETQTEEKSRFLANMSHELRSPLHAIIGISEILSLKNEISNENKQLVAHIRNAGNTLLQQVNSILEYSKLEAGKMELVNSTYNVEKMIQELAQMCIINLKGKPVDLSIQFTTYHPKEFIGDEMRVRAMVQNVLTNAVKYTEKGKIECEIQCAKCPDMKNVFVKCQVKDTGIGMSEEQLNNIFKEYSSYAGERKIEGTGLGMSIVKQLAELMGGSVSVVSDRQSGTIVSVSYYQELVDDMICSPAYIVKDGKMIGTSQELIISKPSYVYPKAKILLADDMSVNQIIFKELVEPWKVQVDCVSDGTGVIEAIKDKDYQMIFLDNMMPKMTGIETAEIISDKTNAPLILLTADISDDKRNEYIKHGFSDFMTKPIVMSELKRVIEKNISKEFCQPVDTGVKEGIGNVLIKNDTYRMTLEHFVKEVEPLIKKIPEYEKNDMDMFRIKVHGIRGISSQVGKKNMSESAEIMEMAAKTNNKSFIESHLDNFLMDLNECLDEVKEEIQLLPDNTVKKKKVTSDKQYNVAELFKMVKEGFDSFNIIMIENAIECLEDMELSDDERILMEKAKEYCDELEYESGSELFEDY